MNEQLKQQFAMALNKLQGAIATTNQIIIKSALIEVIVTGTKLHYAMTNGTCNIQSIMHFLSNNIQPGLLNQISQAEIQNNIQLGLNMCMQQGLNQNFQQPVNMMQTMYQQPMVMNNMNNFQQMTTGQIFQSQVKQAPISAGVCSRYEDDDHQIKTVQPAQQVFTNNKYKEEAKIQPKTNNGNYLNGDKVLLSEGTYIKDGEYCGESVDELEYNLLVEKSDINYNDLLELLLTKEKTINPYSPIRIDGIKIDMNYFVEKEHYGLKRVYNKLNTYLLKYIKQGTYDAIGDETEINAAINNVESKKVRGKLFNIVQKVLEDIKCLEILQKGNRSIIKLKYTAIENIIVLVNSSLFKILNNYNVNNVIVLDKDGYENIYNLVKNNIDCTYLLYDEKGNILEFVAINDLINEERLIINITKKENLL